MKKILFGLAILSSSIAFSETPSHEQISSLVLKGAGFNNVNDVQLKPAQSGREALHKDETQPWIALHMYTVNFKNNESAVKCNVSIDSSVGIENVANTPDKFVSARVHKCDSTSTEAKSIIDSRKLSIADNQNYGFIKVLINNYSEYREPTLAEQEKYRLVRLGKTNTTVDTNVKEDSDNNTHLTSSGVSADKPENNPKKSNSILNNSTVTHIGALLGGAAIGYGVTKLLEKKPKPVPAASSDITSSDSTAPAADDTEPAAEPIMADENQD